MRFGISRPALVLALVLVIAVAGVGGYFLLVPSPTVTSTHSSVSTSSVGILVSAVPTSPLVAPGQTQNYTLLKVTSGSGSTENVTLTAVSPSGLSFELNQTSVSASSVATSVPVVLKASSTLAPGNYSVTVEVRSGSGPGTNQTVKVDVVPMLITMHDVAFHPDNVTVPAGTRITWINLDGTIGCCDPGYHDVSFVTGINETSATLERLQTWSYTFGTPGVYLYYCTIHPWMTASVTVTNSTSPAG